MSSNALQRLAQLVSVTQRLAQGQGERRAAEPSASWSLGELAGRLVELSGAAQLTCAFGLVLDAQRRSEPAAWIGDLASAPFPPDVAEGGVDLDALVVVRVPDVVAIARAADQLIRSGAFGLVLLDLGADPRVTQGMQSRLLGLAHEHDTAIVCLTRKPAHAPSLGSLVSLRGEARHVRGDGGRFTCALRVIKDKRRAPGTEIKEVCRGSAGLR